MGKINPNFPHDIYTFLHKPLREIDKKKGNLFLERFLKGAQTIFEDTQAQIDLIKTLNDPAIIRADLLKYLKDHVGLTSELDNITRDLSDNDLRKLIALAVTLWRQKGLELGYKNIIRLFTGKSSRVFNWFDFRWIVGEKAFGSELRGEDPYLISVVNVTESTPAGNVVLLLPFENGTKDRSIVRNNAVDHARLDYFSDGAVTGSTYYAKFDGGNTTLPFTANPLPGDIVTVPYNNTYDFSGDFTIEMFVRTTFAQNAVLYRWSNGSKVVEIRLRSDLNEISYTLSDGVNTVTETHSIGSFDIDDGVWRHIALSVNRTESTAKIFMGGTEGSAGEDISSLLDLSSPFKQMFIGGSNFETELYQGDMDNLRISLTDQYDVTNLTVPQPGTTFIEFQEEQLDEFKSDVRVVDVGDLNKTLIRRIINLMRPISERINVVFVRAFESFEFGKGSFVTVSGTAFRQDQDLFLPAGSLERFDRADNNFQDINLQVRQKFTADEDGEFVIRFLIQDDLNYYRFRVVEDGDNSIARLESVVAGVVSVLDGPTTIPVFDDTFYIWTIGTDFNNILNETQINVYQDANLVHEVIDSNFSEGTFAVESIVGQSQVSDVELFERPLDVQTVNPGFDL